MRARREAFGKIEKANREAMASVKAAALALLAALACLVCISAQGGACLRVKLPLGL